MVCATVAPDVAARPFDPCTVIARLTPCTAALAPLVATPETETFHLRSPLLYGSPVSEDDTSSMSAVTRPDGQYRRELLAPFGTADFCGDVAPEFADGDPPGFTEAEGDGDGDPDGFGVSRAMNSEMGSSDGNGVGSAMRDAAQDEASTAIAARPKAATRRRILPAA
jgi:hypothetical protein